MKNKMTPMHYFEMGHTAYVCCDILDGHLTKYADKKLTKKVEKAIELLAEVYQEAMAKA